MSKTLVVYDVEGYGLNAHEGGYPAPRLPVGVPYIYEDIPVGKRLVQPKIVGETVPVVDVSVTPHKLILEDIPPTETDLLKAKVDAQEIALMELAEIIAGGAV